MRKHQFAAALAPALLAALSAPLGAQETEAPTPTSIVKAAPESDWKQIAAEDLLVMDLAPDAGGEPRRVVIQLMPGPFSQPWVENIRTLARAHWWDGLSVYRAVDNWVAQWGGGEGEGFNPPALPEGVVSPVRDYTIPADRILTPRVWTNGAVGDFEQAVAPFRTMKADAIWTARMTDPYASFYAFADGFPVGLGLTATPDRRPVPHGPDLAWPLHCYGSVGVARDLAPDTGTGSELYAVIGHAPRQLDRNIAVVGRVIEGIEHLSTLPRGTGGYGVYETREEDTPIVSVRLASEMPEAERPEFVYLDTASESFARYAQVSANRSDAFYTVPAGGIDVCNLKVPVKRVGED